MDRLFAANSGLDAEQIAAIVRQKIDGEIVGEFVVDDVQRDIEMKFAEVPLRDLQGIEIENPLNTLLTLADIAELNITEGPRTIERREQQRAGVVMASVTRNGVQRWRRGCQECARRGGCAAALPR